MTNHMAANKARKRKWAENYKAELGCADCPEKDPICLDFDHRPGEKKFKPVAVMISRGLSWDRIKAEVAKCDVRCTNCHRKRHRNMRASVAQR
jgi:hypothetical protein